MDNKETLLEIYKAVLLNGKFNKDDEIINQKLCEITDDLLNNKKFCTRCKEIKSLDEYYIYKNRPNKYCRKCHNINRRKYKRVQNRKPRESVKKIKGFGALSEDIQKDIIKCISLKISYKTIAERHNIGYSTLCSWIYKKTIPME